MSLVIQERFKAYSPGTENLLGYLPKPMSYDVSYAHNDNGSLTLVYSSLAAGGDLISQDLALGLDVAVEWSFGGAWFEPYNSRFLYIRREGDLADVTKVWTATCPSYGWLFGKVRNLNEGALVTKGDHAGERKMSNKDPGDTIKTFLDEHEARRGTGVPIVRSSWTASNDSGGHAWSKKKTIYYPMGVDMMTILQGLTDISHCDWRFQGRGMKMWNPDVNWTDRSAVVRLRVGVEVSSAPVTESMEDVVTHVFVKGSKKKVKKTIQNTSGPHPWGFWEGYVEEGGIDTISEAGDAAQKELDDHSRVRGQYTYTLTVEEDSLKPLVDYFPGDWVMADTPIGPQKVRVQQITMSKSNNGVLTASIVLNDRFKEAALKAASKLISLTGGSTTIGGSGTESADEVDNRQPDAPTGFTATPTLYLTSAKRWAVRMVFSWSAVTTATDGTALDMTGYQVWGIKGTQTMSIAYTPATTLTATIDDFTPGDSWDFAVQAIGATTQPGVLSAFTTVVMPADTTPPAKPSTPNLESHSSIVTVAWNGLDYTGAAMAADLRNVEVLAGTVNPPTAVVGNLSSAGNWTGFAGAGTTLYVRLKPWDYANNAGTPSDVVSIVVKSILDDPDLTAMLGTKARIYMQDAAPVAPIPAGSWWFTATGATRLQFTAAGAAVGGTATWVPYQFDASQILTTGTILADNIGVNQIVNKHMASHSIDVDVLTGGLLQAEVTLSGIIRTAETGARVEMDSETGIVLYDASGAEVISIRTDGNSRFYGKITASELLVDGVMSLSSDSTMTANPGATVVLSSGIQAPSVSPGVSSFSPKVQLRNADGTPFTGVGCMTRDSTGKFYAAKLGARQIYLFNADGSYNSQPYTIPSTVSFQWSYRYTWVSDLTIIGSTLFAWTGFCDDSGVQGFGVYVPATASWAFAGQPAPLWWSNVALPAALPGNRAVDIVSGYDGVTIRTLQGYSHRLSNDGTNFVVGYVNASSGKECFARIDIALATVISTKTNSTKWTAGQYAMWATCTTSADLGALNHLSSIPSSLTGIALGYVRHTLDSSQANNANVTWPVAVDQTVAVEYATSAVSSLPGTPGAAASFWTGGQDGNVYTHDGLNWTDDALLTRSYKFAFTYYNTTPYESKSSPVTTFAAKKRARIRSSVAGWVVAAPITQLRFYAGLSTLYAQGNNAAGYLDILVPTASGSTPPVSSNFPASTPAKIVNTEGTLSISADGTIFASPLKNKMGVAMVTYDNAGVDFGNGTSNLTASNYTSWKPSRLLYQSDPGFDLVWPAGHQFKLGIHCIARITYNLSFNADTGGNRLIGIGKNSTATSFNSSSSTGINWVRIQKFGPTSDTASGVAIWQGEVLDTDWFILILRATVALKADGNAYNSSLYVEVLRML